MIRQPRNTSSVHKAVVCLLLLLAGCGTPEYKSHWRSREVIIDGKNTEWNGALTALDDKQTSLGLLNDETYLYVALVTASRDLQRQIVRGGITFWLDRDGGQDQKFGIRYPLGVGRPGPQPGGRADREERKEDPRVENAEYLSNELELYGPGPEEHHRMTMAQTGGIEARFRTSNDILVYELKVPLMDNGPHLFAVGTKPGTSIGIGVETLSARNFERPKGNFPGSGGGPLGGRGGGRGPGGIGGQRPPSGERMEPFKMWAKLELAAKDTSSH